MADVAFLEHARLTTEQLRACLRDLQRLPAFPSIAEKIDLGERFVFLEIVLMVHRHGVEYLDSLPGGSPSRKADPKANRLLASMDWDSVLRTGNQWFDRIAAALRVQDRVAREKQLSELDQELRILRQKTSEVKGPVQTIVEAVKSDEDRSQAVGDILIRLLLPVFTKLQHAADRDEQQQRNLHVAFALATCFERHYGWRVSLPAYLLASAVAAQAGRAYPDPSTPAPVDAGSHHRFARTL